MAYSLEQYKQRTERLRWDDLDFGAFHTSPLDEETLRCLRFMHDVEYHTVCYLRDLLLTPAHHDPEITAFLTFWVFEEFWHGEALAAVLAAHDEVNGNARVEAVRQRLGWRDKVRPLLTTVGGWWAKEDFTAVHMTWGAINEWTTQAGYSLLSRKAAHPVLSELLQRIMRQEGRHIDFYASQAASRLQASRRAQKLTRMALSRFWHPVGTGVMPGPESEFITQYLLGDEQGQRAAARVDRQVDRLPGLGGLRLLVTATAPSSPSSLPARPIRPGQADAAGKAPDRPALSQAA